MLTEQRYAIILGLLSAKNSVTVTELKDILNASESTVRRDIFQFCYRDTVFFSEKAEYDLISLLRQHVFPPLKKTPRSAGPGCLLFTHSEITGSPA